MTDLEAATGGSAFTSTRKKQKTKMYLDRHGDRLCKWEGKKEERKDERERGKNEEKVAMLRRQFSLFKRTSEGEGDSKP